MKRIQRYDIKGWNEAWPEDGYDMIPCSSGEWVKYSEVQIYVKDLVESISLGWNAQLISGGALLEEGSNDESKV